MFEIRYKQRYLFKRIGRITKLQKAIEHSTMNVILTYIKGLGVPKFNEENITKLKQNNPPKGRVVYLLY